MKLLLLLLTVALLHVHATGLSQNITWSGKDVALAKVFSVIKKQTGYVFFYNYRLLKDAHKVNLDVKDANIEEVLKRCFKDQPLDYVIENKTIVLAKKVFTSKKETDNYADTTKLVTGTVFNEKGEPLSGATIVVAGTKTATAASASGAFSIRVPENRPRLIISSVGYGDTTIAIGASNTIIAVLKEKITSVDDVVVVGYGTQKKSDLTGAITSVKGAEIVNLPVRSVTEGLQGRVAGVSVTKDDGRPGAGSQITIRGVGSLNGLTPLYIIDGIARSGDPSFNPKDIESIEVIKDASAAAIYGAQAAGGVILVTTKKGSLNQDMKFSFRANAGSRSITNKFDFLRTTDYIKARQAIGQNYPLWSDPSGLPNTNWQDALFKNGVEQSYFLSAQGGTKKMSYYLSGGYEKENGIQLHNFWERVSLRFNADYHPNDRISLGHQIYLYRVNDDPATVNVPWRSLPYMAIYNDDGSFASVPVGVEFSGMNDVATLLYQHVKENYLGALLNVYIDWEVLKGLHLKTVAGGDFTNSFYDNFTETNETGRTPVSAYYIKNFGIYQQYTSTTTLTYKKAIGNHDFTILLGYEAKKGTGSDIQAQASDFPVRVAQSYNLSTNPSKVASGILADYGQYLSQFARLNYTFDNRFLLTANVRRDGSPKFGPDHRYGVFPSVSAGWKMQNEKFFKDLNLSAITTFKPRISWGILGNEATLGSFLYEPAYTPVNSTSLDGQSATTGYSNLKIINKDIKWEQIKTLNIGVDITMFNNRLSLTADYYNKQTSDMIYNLPVPTSSGIVFFLQGDAPTMPVNIGKISNKGYEIAVSYNNKLGDFSYSIGANLSHNSNKMIDLGVTSGLYAGDGTLFQGTSPFKTINGQPIGQIYGYKADGIIQNQDQIDKLNVAAAAANGAGTYYQNALTGPGDLLFHDVNGDGKITEDDRTYIGNPWPKFQYGFTLNLNWKGFDLAAQIVGVAGRDVLNLAKAYEQSFKQDFQSTYQIFGASNFLGNGITGQPRFGFTDNNGNFVTDPNLNYLTYSSYYVQNGSYLKIKNISIGYTLPASVSRSMKLDRLRIFFTGQNLFTFTKFTGLDPEFSNDVKSYGLYTMDNYYPQTKLISAGLEIQF